MKTMKKKNKHKIGKNVILFVVFSLLLFLIIRDMQFNYTMHELNIPRALYTKLRNKSLIEGLAYISTIISSGIVYMILYYK